MRVEQVALTSEVREALETTRPDPALYRLIADGTAQVWSCNGGRTYLVTETIGATVWYHAMAGAGLNEVMPYMIRSAERQGFKIMRATTRRPGIVRMLKRWHWFALGTIRLRGEREWSLMRLVHVIQ